ncbi:GNAT family N-acetyltransferase [Phytoactinopolyspora endophytica]|uniref:GNAT family N-acetyltransferase n=1 Tax=Phytoactinopolyspora endophytica TaxID=1642495 RepID=UPI00197C778E|nr:GNAT family N-acetyltransferase [Phytoactinopolyspora endophytica]
MTDGRRPGTVGTAAPDAAAPTRSPGEAARMAAERSGVEVRLLHDLTDLTGVVALFDRIWRPDGKSPLVNIEQLRALTHAGNYLAGAFDSDGRLVGACVGFFAAPPGVGLHSHIAGVDGQAQGRSVGFALKLHQRVWARERGLTEITWTFDPLIRRNAYFNFVKLGARPREYLVDFYGEIDDAINAGQGTDRLLVAWQLASDAVAEICVGNRVEADVELMRADGAVVALAEGASGLPEVASAALRNDARTLLVRIPADVEALRRSDPGAAKRWRLALRDVLGELIDDGASVTGFSRSGWYTVERHRHPRRQS